eukprot:13784402-Alexandrium_andersonii.AAC.1
MFPRVSVLQHFSCLTPAAWRLPPSSACAGRTGMAQSQDLGERTGYLSDEQLATMNSAENDQEFPWLPA